MSRKKEVGIPPKLKSLGFLPEDLVKQRNQPRFAAIFGCVLPTVLLMAVLVFSGCTALTEAQKRREKRLLEKRNASSLMLKPSDTAINIREDALFGESDHYTIKFAHSCIWRAFTMR